MKVTLPSLDQDYVINDFFCKVIGEGGKIKVNFHDKEGKGRAGGVKQKKSHDKGVGGEGFTK